MFTGFIKCDCNGVCIEVNPFICTTIKSCIEVTVDPTGNCPEFPGFSVFEYTNCDGVYQTVKVSGGDLPTFCTLVGGVTPAFICGNGILRNGPPCFSPTSTSTTTSTSTSSTTTTTTTAANNRWQYEYLSYTCTLCESIEYGFLYNSNPLTLDNFYQYGDIVITPFVLVGVDTGISNASIPDTGVATCEEINCFTTTTTTTRNLKVCKIVSMQALKVEGGSWSALDCLGESVSGTVPFPGITDTPCIEFGTLLLEDADQTAALDCGTPPRICQEYQIQGDVGGGSWVALNCLGESVGGIIPEGNIISTNCIYSDTLDIVNGGIKLITPC
jgi:hypothetical protein